jgi:hypothetical protein
MGSLRASRAGLVLLLMVYGMHVKVHLWPHVMLASQSVNMAKYNTSRITSWKDIAYRISPNFINGL